MNFTVDITQIILSVMGIVLSIAMAWLAKVAIPPLKTWLEAHATDSQRKLLINLVEELVKAAEQMYGAGRGSDKYQYVVDQLEIRGFKVDSSAIEAAVKDMNDKLINKLEKAKE